MGVMGTDNPDNYDSPEFIGDREFIFVIVFIGIQIIAVALRFYARALTTRKYGLDDWLVIASLLSIIAIGALSLSAIKQGIVGYHMGYLEKTNPEAITLYFKYLVVFSTWFYASSCLSRLAICVLYYHLFPQRPVLIVLYIITAVLICLPIITVIMALAACRPFSAAWAAPEIQASHCINREALFLWSIFPNILVDLALLTLPIPIIWRLATTIHLKVALTVTFLIGSIGFVATVLHFVAFYIGHSMVDSTFIAVNLVFWTMAEPGMGLISACIIMYRPLFKKFNGWFKKRTSARTTSWPVSYRSPSISGRALEESERGIALRNESSIEQILDGDARSHCGRVHVPENGR
ncbi:hypothetical protein F4818DRAFT_445055 [Hypoxylon cercidicola]|nr:hypothetical protein F4818DRAFT_445055 [Hypoxylon cercidicola]